MKDELSVFVRSLFFFVFGFSLSSVCVACSKRSQFSLERIDWGLVVVGEIPHCRTRTYRVVCVER